MCIHVHPRVPASQQHEANSGTQTDNLQTLTKRSQDNKNVHVEASGRSNIPTTKPEHNRGAMNDWYGESHVQMASECTWVYAAAQCNFEKQRSSPNLKHKRIETMDPEDNAEDIQKNSNSSHRRDDIALSNSFHWVVFSRHCESECRFYTQTVCLSQRNIRSAPESNTVVCLCCNTEHKSAVPGW